MLQKVEKGKKDPLDWMWQAFRRSKVSRDENHPETTPGLPEAATAATGTTTSVCHTCSAGIGQPIFTGHEYDEQTGLYQMSASVKGCKTPARSIKHDGLREPSVGRRLTSLEGGNRGVLSAELGYGDLKIVS
jgi:hypothetical protein